MNKIILPVTLLSLVLYSCVPMKQFNDVKLQNQQCQTSRDSVEKLAHALEVEKTELVSQNAGMQQKIEKLVADTNILFVKCKDAGEQNVKLTEINNALMDKQTKIVKDNAEEAKRMLGELQASRADLQKREDSLYRMQASQEKERLRLDKLKADLALKDEEISLKNLQMKELERVLSSKDSASKALKAKISAALKGFEGNGLTVTQRDGKIYVSLEEQLLFETGKYEVNPKGADAIRKLAAVLEKNPDINIQVEGHTDSTGIAKWNWKLSTDRALAISAIILENNRIDGKRLTAAGRGQFSPIDSNSTPEGRTKNRRCDIILTPKLDDLLKAIE